MTYLQPGGFRLPVPAVRVRVHMPWPQYIRRPKPLCAIINPMGELGDLLEALRDAGFKTPEGKKLHRKPLSAAIEFMLK